MSKPRIYIDTSCFIDIISHKIGENLEEERNTEVDFLKRLLKAIENGDIEAYTSGLTIAECRKGQKSELTDEVKRLIRSILSSGKVITLVESTIFINEDARDLEWNHNISLKGADAVHIATALDRKCEEFLTVDRGIHSKKTDIEKLGLRVVKPSESLSLPDEYKQGNMFDDKPEETEKN